VPFGVIVRPSPVLTVSRGDWEVSNILSCPPPLCVHHASAQVWTQWSVMALVLRVT
jgi:hypothetical protein